MVIDGKDYTSDLKIFPDGIKDNWWRRSGHILAIEDVSDILSHPPEVLIIGTGSAGVLKVPEDVQQYIENQGITLIIQRTGEAYKTYNKLKDIKHIVAAFHLTC
jgi:hypothetical protein